MPPGEFGFELARFLPYKLSALSGLTQRLLEVTLARGGVTLAQWRVYVCLITHGPSPLNRIVGFTNLPQSSLSRSIAAMHDRGLVRNARDATDRRLARIEITAKGRRDFAALTAAIEAACADVFRMDPDEEARLIRRIDALIARLSAWRRREAGAMPPAPAAVPRSTRSRAVPVHARASHRPRPDANRGDLR